MIKKNSLRTRPKSLSATAVNGGFPALRCSRISNTLRGDARKSAISNSSQRDFEQVLKNFGVNNLLVLSVFGLVIAAAVEVLQIYSELFYEFGNLAKSRFAQNSILAFFTVPVLFWFSAYLCRRFSKHAAGNTINHLESSLDYLQKNPNSFGVSNKAINLRSIFVSIISSLVATFGGGALGKEAPSVYISAAIFGVTARKLRIFMPKISLENWLSIGIAIGFAAAFHAPIAGFIYVIEKLIRAKSKTLFSSSIFTAIALLLMIFLLREVKPIFATQSLNFCLGLEIFIVALLAIFCGLSSFWLKKISGFFYAKTVKIKSLYWHFVPILAGFAVAIVSFYAGDNSFGGGVKNAQNIIAGAELSYLQIAAQIFNTITTFIAGCAGGIVAPSISIGASIGKIFSNFAPNIDANIFVLNGMVAFLTPILNTPLASAFLIVETAKQPLLAFPFLLLSSTISFFTSSLITRIIKR